MPSDRFPKHPRKSIADRQWCDDSGREHPIRIISFQSCGLWPPWRLQMKNILSVQSFRRMTMLEEQMMRASMPKTSAADPEPLRFAQERSTVVGSIGGTRLARRSMAALTYTMAEVAHV